MLDDSGRVRLISLLYEAVSDEGRWPEAMGELTRLLDCSRAQIFMSDGEGVVWQQALNVPDETIRAFAGFRDQDEWLRRRWQWSTEGAGIGTEVLPFEELRRTGYYNDFARRAGYAHLAGVMLSNGLDQIGALGLFRGEDDDPYGAVEQDAIRWVAPHVKGAIRLSIRIARLQNRLDAVQGAIDRIDVGLVLLDADRRIVFQNAAAEAMLRRCGSIRSVKERLAAPGAADAEKLRAALAAACGGPGITRTARRLTVGDPLEGGLVVLHAIPLTAGSGLARFASRPVAAVLFRDGSAPSPVQGNILRDAFALTEREQAVAEHLARGEDLQSFADRHNLSINTVRPYLRSVFEKVGVHRQGELVRLVNALAL